MHLACIISVLGPPPLDTLHRGKESSRYFYDEGTNSNIMSCEKENKNPNGIGTGKFKFPELVRESGGLEAMVSDIEENDRRMFLNFISRMLQWRPEDRSNVGELLSDPWLQE